MRNIGENEITNMGGDFNYINCECMSEISDATEVTLTLDSNTGKYYLEGVSTQDGTPTPDNPVEIENTYKAGHYKTTIGGNTYRFSLGDDLRSIGNIKDKFELDITNRNGSITKNISNVIFNGDENWTLSSTAFYLLYNETIPLIKPNSLCYCTHYAYGSTSNKISIQNNWRPIIFDVVFSGNTDNFKSWLAAQEADGLPVILHYQLETATIESVEVD